METFTSRMNAASIRTDHPSGINSRPTSRTNYTIS